MADTDSQQTLMVTGGGANVVENEKLEGLTVQTVRVSDTGEITPSDILQQALREASENYEQVAVAYATVENGVTVLHGTLAECSPNTSIEKHSSELSQVTLNDVSVVDGISVSAASVEEPQPLVCVTQASGEALAGFATVDESDVQSNQVEQIQDVGVEQSINNQDVTTLTVTTQNNNLVSTSTPVRTNQQVQAATVPGSNAAKSPSSPIKIKSTTGDSFQHLSLPTKSTSAPLGSSENPIQIIQQGNTYHSTQVLTPDQLQQIAHVLQQQQVTKAIQNGGSAVVYNPETNTRIIYRVIYPSELTTNKQTPTRSVGRPPGSGVITGKGRGRGRPKRGWNKRVEDDDSKSEGPDMSREEKEEKKKHRPRTRSGRISRPPSYMVKDYKRIHHLDFDEEPYDDSDGGYSDYHVSDEEERRERRGQHPYSLPPGVTTAKPRNFKCVTCEKAYIGKGGLCRHFRLYPDHGNASDLEELSTHDENSNSSMMSVPGTQLSPGESPANSLNSSLDAVKKDQQAQTPSPAPTRGGFRAGHDIGSLRRKARLRDVVRLCRDDELIETVLPRLAQVVTLWEVLLLKSERGDPPKPHIPNLIKHFSYLLSKLRKLSDQCLTAQDESQDDVESSDGKLSVEVKETLAQALGLTPGFYNVKADTPIPDGILPFKRALLKPQEQVRNHQMKRPAAASRHEEQPPAKRIHLTQSASESQNQLPLEESLNSDSLSENMLQDVENLDLSTLQTDGVSEDSVETSVAKSAAEASSTSRLHFEFTNSNKIVTTIAPSASQRTHVVNSSDAEILTTKEQPSIQVHRIHVMGQSLLNNNHLNKTVTSLVTSTEQNLTQQVEQVSEMSPVPPTSEQLSMESIVLNSNEVQKDNETVIMENDHQRQEEEVCETTEVVPESDPESKIQVLESHMKEDDSQEMTQVVCTEEDAALVTSTASSDGSGSVIRQFVLPDGQIIGTLEGDGQFEQLGELGEHILQGLVPGNVVIVQNSDGSTMLQMPPNQTIPLETVQALLAMDGASVVHTEGDVVDSA